VTGVVPAAGGAATRPPVISVVIPAFNSEAYLGACLDSVLAQTGDFALEVIVVDDGSTDGTAGLALTRPGVRLLRQSGNGGPSHARNAGLAAASGACVAFLDADDLWPPGSLGSRVDVLKRQPGAALVFGDCRQFDDRGPRAQTLLEAGGLGRAAWGTGEIVPDAYRLLLHDNFITTGSVVARRAALAAEGGFAEDLRLVEDLDLWLRLARRHAVAWCGEVCLLRRRHADNLSRDAKAMSLAYLEVLRRQCGGEACSTRGWPRQLASLAAREHLQLADIALRQGRPGEALQWAGRSLKTRPSARAAWRMGQAAWQRLRARAPAGHG
jgi:glycosyltransferase involved in cell wall biosynthesis